MSLESLDLREVESAIEGILFASGEPLAIDRICLALDLDRPTAEQVLQKLGDYYAFERRGIRLIRMEDSYQLCSSPDYADVIRKAFEIRKTAKLSQPALEVLTIIAYYQPTTRAYVDQVRGVDSSYTVGLLLERGLIEECGRLQVPGRPRLYRTTKKFLRDFHLGSLEELPEMPGLEADGQLRMTDDGTILDPGSLAAKEEAPITPVTKKNLRQWMLKITAYADRLLDDPKRCDDIVDRLPRQQRVLADRPLRRPIMVLEVVQNAHHIIRHSGSASVIRIRHVNAMQFIEEQIDMTRDR